MVSSSERTTHLEGVKYILPSKHIIILVWLFCLFVCPILLDGLWKKKDIFVDFYVYVTQSNAILVDKWFYFGIDLTCFRKILLGARDILKTIIKQDALLKAVA